MIDWDAMLSGGELQPPAPIEVGQAAANQGEDAPEAVGDGVVFRHPERAGDNRRRCSECDSLTTNGRCLAAARRELVASRTYAPAPDWLRRCECFKPLPSDPDQRAGRDRWPGL